MTSACGIAYRNQILIGASLAAMVFAAQSAKAQCVVDADGVCVVTNSGNSGDIAASPSTRIINTGTIGNISQTGGGFFLVDNRVGGSVGSATFSGLTSGTGLTPDGPYGNVFINAGTVNGNVSFQANQSQLGSQIFVNDGGTVNGSVTTVSATGQGSGFINRSTTDSGVTGALNFGGSTDHYITSFATSGAHNLSAALPTSFESGGVEALGATTVVTLAGSGNDIILAGNGSVVNNGVIGSNAFWIPNLGQLIGTSTGPLNNSAVSYAGVAGQEYFVSVGLDPIFGQLGLVYGEALSSFTNNGEINGDLTYLRTATFSNSGDINLRSSDFGTVIIGAADQDFAFTNSGTISMAHTDVRVFPSPTLPDAAIALVTAINSDTLKSVSILNTATGEIDGGLTFAGVASDFTFDNSGTISIGDNPNDIDRAVEIEIGDFLYALNPGLRGDVPTASATITNSGTLDGGISFAGTPHTFSFANNGAITSDPNDPFANAVDIEVTGYGVPGGGQEIDAQSVSVVNNGTIGGTVSLGSIASQTVTIINTGDILRALTPGGTLFAEGAGGLEVKQSATADATLTFTNSGTISSADHAAAGVSISVQAGDLASGDPLASTAIANVTVTNTGTISASGGTYLTPGSLLGLPANQILADFGAALAVDTVAEGASSITITNETGGVISGRGAAYLGTPGGAQLVPNQPANASTLAVAAHADTVTIVNKGRILGEAGGPLMLPGGILVVPTVDADVDFENIVGSAIDTFEGDDTVTNTATGDIEGGIALRSGNDTLTNLGTINGNVDLGGGNDWITNSGTLAGNVSLGDGNDIYIAFLNDFTIHNTGLADGGNGGDTMILLADNGGSLQDYVAAPRTNFEFVALGGAGTVTSDGTVTPVVQLTGDITLAAGSTVNAGQTFAFRSDGSVPIDNVLTNRGTINGCVDLGSGDDLFVNYGTLTGDLDLGAGDDTFVQGINAVFGGIADGGVGNDTFTLDITGGGTISNTLYAQLSNFEVLGLTGTGTIISNAPLPVDTIELAPEGGTVDFDAGAVIQTAGDTAVTGTSASDDLTNRGTIIGNVDLGSGDNLLANIGNVTGNVTTGSGVDQISNSGTIDGNLDLGGGDDVLVLETGWAITGGVSGGDGHDEAQASFAGTDDQPDELDLSQFSQVEQFTVNGGTGAINGDATFEEVDVNAGRLIGRAGSTITGDVNVGTGAVFGSAGTVNGDIAVNGTLSPGSSPGTMTINGDVILASGSTTAFEFTPTVSDAIIITGALSIESGTTLNITGERPLTPGVTYNLITASDGITGTFTTTNKVDTVKGFLSYTANSLQLLGTFQTRDAVSPQISATNSYLNSLLIGGTATTGILAAVPQLVGADGFANEAAMATIHPEAYASASQIGIESGLAISSALRANNAWTKSDEAGLFAFGQGFGTRRLFGADSGSGVSKADVRTSGFLGGIGFGNESFALSAFVGRVYGRQPISAVGAVNESDGTFAGASLRFASGGLTVGGSFVWDGSSADTSRKLFDGSTARSHYRLRGTTYDGHIGYNTTVGSSAWKIGPQLGITHVSVKRAAASEIGAGAFALDVKGRTAKATFLSADLNLSMDGGTLRPWLSAGWRHRLDSDPSLATASITGVAGSFTVAGARRDTDFANIGVGVNWKVASSVNLFLNGNTEFGADNGAHSLTGGLRVRF